MSKEKTFSTEALKKICLTSYFLLLVFMPLWLIVLVPSQGLSPILVLVMFTLPLLIPAKGLIKGNPYTYAWSNFILMIYFLHSLTTIWVLPEEWIFALIEFVLTTSMFLSGTYYAKYRGQELGLSIRKKNKSAE